MSKFLKILPKLLLYLLSAITVVVTILEFGGGVVDPSAEYVEPNYLDLYLGWTVIVIAIAVLATLIMSLTKLSTSFRKDTKGSVRSLIGFILFIGLLLVTYSLGSDTPLKIIGYEGTESSDPFWLKTTDMFLISTMILLGICIVLILWGSIKGVKKSNK